MVEILKQEGMDQEIVHQEGRLGRVMGSLHTEGSTGTLCVNEGKTAFTFNFLKGHLVHADGIDKEGPLLAELVSKGRINLKELDELRVLKDKNPQKLGETLLARKLVSETLWREFNRRKAKVLLSAAFDMENPDLLFTESGLDLVPVNFIGEESLSFVLDTVRKTTPHSPLREILKSKHGVFSPSPDAISGKTRFPLNPSEEQTLSFLGRGQTAKEILNSSGLTPRLFQKSLYCLIRLGLVGAVAQQQPVSAENSTIIRLYVNLLFIVEAAFRQEIGKRSHKVLQQCVRGMAAPGRALFADLDPVNGNPESVAKKIAACFMNQQTLSDGRLVLLTSFSKLLYLLILRMKKLLGKERAMKTIQEMIRTLAHFDPGKKHPETLIYARINLEDLARQLQS